MGQYEYKDMTLEVFRRLRSAPEFRNYPHLGISTPKLFALHGPGFGRPPGMDER